MKKIIAVLLSASMLIGASSLTAFAENGPLPFNPEHMPAWGPALVCFSESGQEDTYIYSGGEIKNDALTGVTYDLSSNTLTVNDVQFPAKSLNIHMMGDDFKLKVEGECELGVIYVNDYEYSSSLTITGSGALDINKSKNNPYAVSFFGGQPQKALNIDKAVTVNMFSDSDKLFNCSSVTNPDPNAVFLADGKSVEGITGGEIVNQEYETVKVARVVNKDTPYYIGKRVYSHDDPEGVYTAFSYLSDPDTFYVTHYIYYPVLDIYREEAGFGGELSSAKKMTKEDFQTEFSEVDGNGSTSSLYNNGILTLLDRNVWLDSDGNRYAADDEGNVFSFSDDKTVTIKDYDYSDDEVKLIDQVYYLPEPTDLKTEDLISTAQDVHTGKYNYALNGSEYHHEGKAEPDYLIGDVNDDGKVNGADAGLLNRYTSGWEGYAEKIKNMDAADINRDGKVNGADSGLLNRYTSGWENVKKYFAA